MIRRRTTVPPAAVHRVPRPRVERHVATLVEQHRTVVVSAAAGAGKTTAVAGGAALLGWPVAWLTSDWTDADPARLVTYLEAALAATIPGVAGAATGELRAGLAPIEAAGVLAEAVGDTPFVAVLDELEHLVDARAPWAVLDAFLRYAPASLHAVLVSRRPVPGSVRAVHTADDGVAAMQDADLALTPGEARGLLDALGPAGAATDAAAAVRASGGWMTGVLLEAGAHGNPAAVDDYLAANVVDPLPAEDRRFLVATSLLEEVSAADATALGVPDAPRRIAALRATRLPVTWYAGGHVLRCPPHLREHLLERLDRLPGAEVRALRLARGRMLAGEGRDEDAVEALLRAGALEDALTPARRAILAAGDRLDLATAARWLPALQVVAPPDDAALAVAELVLALPRLDVGSRMARTSARLAAHGARDAVARSSGAAAALLAWAAVQVGRPASGYAVLTAAGEGRAAAAGRYALAVCAHTRRREADAPELYGGPLDTLVLATHLRLGRLAQLSGERLASGDDDFAMPWRIAALRATGHTGEALALYEAATRRGLESLDLRTHIGPELLLDAGHREPAREAIADGRRIARASGAPLHEVLNGLVEAKLAVRLDRDPEVARDVLARLDRHPVARAVRFAGEAVDALHGLALLLLSEDAAALVRLRRTVERMLAGDRMLELPGAAVYLAEAERRNGDDRAAAHAAGIALHAAARQGSDHLLLQALADVPTVVAGRIGAEADPDGRWHALGRAVTVQSTSARARGAPRLRLREFGRRTILLDGHEVRPRIAKAYELLAYLVAAPGRRAAREDLLEALFDGRSDDSARAYLRQAIHQVAALLPGDEPLEVDRRRVRLRDEVSVSSESAWFEDRLVEAARLQGARRLAATVEALAVLDDGEYLPGARSGWVEDRRRHLTDLATQARYEAAELAFAAGSYADARRLAGEVLRADPFREAAWRLAMRIAEALGDPDGVIRAYRGCDRALAEIGTRPSGSSRKLLERLRR